MTTLEMHNGFEIELNKLDSKLMVDSHRILYWLNRAVEEFVKVRYSGVNPKGEGFEQSQKRIDDLRSLVVSDDSGSISQSGDVFTVTLPADYAFLVNDRVLITSSDVSIPDAGLEIGVTEVTENNLNQRLDDPFSEHILYLGKAKPLRLITSNGVVLYTDGEYDVDTYYLTYIKIPDAIDYSTNCNLPEHAHPEVIKLAVQMCLESLGERRYETYTDRVNKME